MTQTDLAKELLEHWVLVLMFLILIFSMAGYPNTGLGVHNMFHDDESLIEDYVDNPRIGWRAFASSPAIFVQCFTTIFAVTIWSLLYTMAFIGQEDVPPTVMHDLVPTAWPHVLATAAVSLLFGSVAFTDLVKPLQRFEWFRCLIGVGLGLIAGQLMMLIAVKIHPALPLPEDLAPTMAVVLTSMIVVLGLGFSPRLITAIAMISLFCLIVPVYALINMAPETYHPLIFLGIVSMIVLFSNLGAIVTAWVAGALMLSMIMATIWILQYVNESYHAAVLIGMILLLPLIGTLVSRWTSISIPLKFQVPGIVDYHGHDHYVNPLPLSSIYDGHEHAKEMPDEIDEADAEEIAQLDELLKQAQRVARAEVSGEEHRPGGYVEPRKVDPLKALIAWKERVSPDAKPKLVLLATSGGAYRASFWTAQVLDSLAAMDAPGGSLEGFTRNIRLVTGASGGMVGGAYFVSMMQAGGPLGSIEQQLLGDIRASQQRSASNAYPYPARYPIQGDSLSAVAQQLVQKDIPRLFLPGIQTVDRGVVLEDQWLSINKSFGEIRNSEADGICPSIIFSPMLAETGQPLLITNLDMSTIHSSATRETVEFFDWFPYSRESFKLKTAVRLNAAFPYIAPAAALPTAPYRRVVDAGYYDNYGVDLAVAYLSQPDIRDWIVKNVSGVMIVQVRAFPFQPPDKPDPGAVARGLQWLTTPLDGALAARGSTMRYRNSQSLRRLQALYDIEEHKTGGPHFVRTVSFEAYSNSSLSWYMPRKELEDLRLRGVHPLNRFAMQGIEAFWRGEPPPTELDETPEREIAPISEPSTGPIS